MKVQIPSNTTSAIVYAGIKERVLMNKFFESQNNFSIDNVSKVESDEKWDMVITSGGTPYICEVKNRQPYPSFKLWDGEGFIYEKKKHNVLIQMLESPKSIECGTQLLYINFFSDGVIVFEPQKIKHNWVSRPFKKHTMRDGSPVIKCVSLLLSEQGTFYPINFNISEIDKECEVIWRSVYPGLSLPKKK
jgi:hypothetical protein